MECQDGRHNTSTSKRWYSVRACLIWNLSRGTAAKRKTMVSTGDRSAKIRTYNYPQGRVTDHKLD